MPRVVQLLVLAVGLSGLPVAVPAPVPKELKTTPTRLVLRYGGPTLDPKKMAWGVDLVVEWERSKDHPAGMRITKWDASSPFPVFDETSLRAIGTAEPKNKNAVRLKANAEHIMTATKTRPLAKAWEPTSSFGFSPQPGEANPTPPTVNGLYRLTATVELFASKTKQFDFTVTEGESPTLAAAGADTTRVLNGDLTFFFAECPADGLIHSTLHGSFGGASVSSSPNAVRLPAKGKFEQGSQKDAPLKVGNGYEFEWRLEYTAGSK